MNIVVLQGHLARPARSRRLPSGAELVTYADRRARASAGRDRARVWEAPGAPTDLEPDTEVVVVGRVRRRFFRAGGSTQSRTEVVAEGLVGPPAWPSGPPATGRHRTVRPRRRRAPP